MLSHARTPELVFPPAQEEERDRSPWQGPEAAQVQGQGAESQAPRSWDKEVEVKLLPKMHAPEEFKMLRPRTVLESAARWPSHVLMQVWEEFDMGVAGTGHPDRAMIGFRKCRQCSELIAVVRNALAKCTEWDIPLDIKRIYFAHACDSVRHDAVWNAMYRRGVPVPRITTYLRELVVRPNLRAWELA